MNHNNKYGIIDFNLSGDEVLLGDLLITWYSSRYSNRFIYTIPKTRVKEIREQYFYGYNSARSLSNIEKWNIDRISKILNGIYFNRFVSDLVCRGKISIGKRLYQRIYNEYFVNDTSIDLYKEVRQ